MNMLSPGEQPRSRPVTPREVMALLLVCAVAAVFLILQGSKLNEYRLY